MPSDTYGLPNEGPAQLYPFTETRDILDIRIGITTIREKTPEARQVLLAKLKRAWDIFQLNEEWLRLDFQQITQNRISVMIPESVLVSRSSNIFIEEGAKLSHCILNARTGPIYIGKNAEIMEGATIRGPFAMLEGSVVKMGTRIYGATTLGPNCVAGGEIKNSVLFGYSNKAHDGYLGDSVIGEWCNLGAGTSNSNLRNTGGLVKAWNQGSGKFEEVGPKCGLLMGDYSRSAVNTAFNTGTVVGVSSNVFGAGLTPKHIPSFSWGFEAGGTYRLEKAMEDIINWKKMKDQALTESEIQNLKSIFERIKL